MSTLKDLIKQQETLAKQIEELRISEKEEAIGKVFVLINEYGLTQEDLYGSRKSRNVFEKSPRAKVLPIYRDSKTGNEWTGRGRTPRWLDGKNRDDYLINKPVAAPTAVVAPAAPKQVETAKTMPAAAAPTTHTLSVKPAGIVETAKSLFGSK